VRFPKLPNRVAGHDVRHANGVLSRERKATMAIRGTFGRVDHMRGWSLGRHVDANWTELAGRFLALAWVAAALAATLSVAFLGA
jgi:hypothetical protein